MPPPSSLTPSLGCIEIWAVQKGGSGSLLSIDTVQLVANNVGTIMTQGPGLATGPGSAQGPGLGTEAMVGIGGDFSQWSAATNQLCSLHGLGSDDPPLVYTFDIYPLTRPNTPSHTPSHPSPSLYTLSHTHY